MLSLQPIVMAQYLELDHRGPYAAPAADSLSRSSRKQKSPAVALALSAALPGLGQVYNGSYWKVPVIAGLGGWFVYNWVDNNDQYRNYRGLYVDSISPSLPSGDRQLRLLRDFYRDQRDKFAWYIGILYFANVIDAYVDASLKDFDVSDDLSITLVPLPGSISVSIHF